MVTTTHKDKAKLAAGAVLVTLSGFVPDAINNIALADTATINASGTFSDGISLAAGTNLLFNTIVATNSAGTAKVTPGGATAVSKAVFVGVTQKAGTFAFNGAVTQPVDVTLVSGIQSKITLPTQGKITVSTVAVSGPFTTTFTGGGLVKKSLAIGVGNRTVDINVGAGITWSGAVPLGKFSVPIKISVAY